MGSSHLQPIRKKQVKPLPYGTKSEYTTDRVVLQEENFATYK